MRSITYRAMLGFQGMLDKDKTGKPYGQFPWRIGLLTPVEKE